MLSLVNIATVSDDRLVTLARADNDEAFSELAARCAPLLHHLSLKYGGNQGAEDMAQEGLLGLLSAVLTYHIGAAASFRTYAYSCMRNRMLSAARKTVPSAEELSEEVSLPVVEGGEPEALLLRRESLESLRRQLRFTLSALEYQVFLLHLSSYSYEEIAAELSLGIKTVDNALQRARRKLSASSIRL